MISIPVTLIESVFLPGLLSGTRLIGLFVSAPFFALQSIPMRFRIALGLLLGFGIPLETNVLSSLSLTMSTASYATLAVGEFLIGAVSGWLIRIGLMVFDVSAEVISIQTGLSFASSYNPDQALPSGVLGQVFGLLGLALIFSLNIHLVAVEILFDSFRSLPAGKWPVGFDLKTIGSLVSSSFSIGLVLFAPFVVINLVVMGGQGFLGRTSPQMNLFSIGFGLSIPIGIFLLYVLLPVFPQALQRSLEPPFAVLRQAFL